MNEEPSYTTTNFRLTNEMKAKLKIRALNQTVISGFQVSMGDVIRQGCEMILAVPQIKPKTPVISMAERERKAKLFLRKYNKTKKEGNSKNER